MSNQVPVVPSSITPRDVISCSSANFQPSVWGDHFLSLVSDSSNVDEKILQEHQELKEEMRSVVKDVMEEPFRNLHVIDAIQHLTVDYHFKDEIEIALRKLRHSLDNGDDYDLNTTAILFRLLRQNGIHATSDVFEKFKDKGGNFKLNPIDDVEGLLSLYEATHLGIHGEDILDEAMAFTISSLQSILLTDNMKPHLREKIKHALNYPIYKCIHRLEARHYMDIYPNEESHNASLLKFAKLDFNILQRQHQKELRELTKWGKSLDLATRFPYARYRIVELYFWIVAVYFEPQYSLTRMIFTKVSSIQIIMDDTYDNRATYKEAMLLTKAIRRWDVKEIDTLPEYMKIFYIIMIDTFNEFEEEVAREGREFCVYYAKEKWKELAQAYHDEVKWRDEGHVPKIEDYMKVSSLSCGYLMLGTTSLLGMGNTATKEVFEWISTNPKIVNGCAVICRLMDDITSHEFEQKREHAPSSIECYMRQYKVKEEQAIQSLQKEIANAWKDINEELLHLKAIPMLILKMFLNFARVMHDMYKEADTLTNPHLLKHQVSSLFVDPVDFPL